MIPWNLGSSILRGAILQSIVTVFFSLSTLTSPAWTGRARGKMSKVKNMRLNRFMSWSPLFVSKANDDGGLVGVRPFQVTGADEQPAAVYRQAGVNHAGRFHVGLRREIEGPKLSAAGQVQGVDYPLE